MALCEAHLPPAFEITRNPGSDLTHRARCWLQHPEAPAVDDVHQAHREANA
jgi:hypothetical protein